MTKTTQINFILTCFIVFFLLATNAFAEVKNVDEYKVFVGEKPETSVAFSWRVNLGITGNYTNNGNSYTLDSIHICAYEANDHMLTHGHGDINGSISETIDYGTTVTRRLLSNEWNQQAVIVPANSYVYFSKRCYPNKVFKYLAEETADYGFVCDGCVIYNPDCEFSLSISGPR